MNKADSSPSRMPWVYYVSNKAEVIEAVSVATSMGGTTANAWVRIVVQMMKELGNW